MFTTPFAFLAAPAGGYDADAQAFFNAITAAGGSLTTTEKNATNTLVLDLKGYSIWTLMIGLWPVVGTTSVTQSFNLKNTAQYNLGFNGTWTHTSAGASPGAGYATTGIIPSVVNFQSLGSIHYCLYITENYPAGAYDIGSYTSSGGDWGAISSFFSNGLTYVGAGTGWFTASNGGNTKKNWLWTNDGSTSTIYRDGSSIGSGAKTISAGSSVQLVLSANNNNGSIVDYSERSWALASIGLGMNATQAANYNTAVVAFQTALSRQN
jgi:hypothetical protein